jgi:hypothetical protein
MDGHGSESINSSILFPFEFFDLAEQFTSALVKDGPLDNPHSILDGCLDGVQFNVQVSQFDRPLDVGG